MARRKSGKGDVNIVITVDDQGTPVIKRAAKEVAQSLGGVDAAAKKTGTGLDKMRDKVAASESGWKKLAGALKSPMVSMAAGMGIWTGMSAVINSVTSNIKDVVTKGREFDSAFAKVKVMLGGSSASADELRNSLMRMSPTLGSSEEMARMLAVSLREFASIPIADQFKIIETASKLATSAFTTNDLALEALIALMKGYKLEAADSANVASLLTRSVQLEDVSFEEMTKTILKLGPSAFQAGLTIEELVATFLTLMHTGQDAQTSMMQMRMLLQGIIKPSDMAKKAAADLGLQWGAAGVKSQGFVKWLSELNKAAGTDLNVLDNLFQGGRTLVGVLNLTSTAAEELTGNVKDLGDAYRQGDLNQQTFVARLKSVNFLAKTTGEMFTKFKVAIWEGLTTQLMKGSGSADEIKKKIDSFANSLVTAGTNIGKNLVNVFSTIGNVVKAIWSMRDAIKELIQLYAVWWMWQKRTLVLEAYNAAAKGVGNLGAALSLVLEGKGFSGKLANLGTLIGGKLGAPIAGVGGLLKSLPAVGMAAFAGWKIGRVIGESTGLDKWLQNVIGKLIKVKAEAQFGEGHEPAAKLRETATARASELSGRTVTKITEANDILRKEFEKTGTLGSDVLDAWASGLGWVVKSAKDAAVAAAAAVDPVKMTEAELKAFDEMTKRIGVTTKSELAAKLKESEAFLANYKGQLTTDEEEKLKKSVLELRIQLGLVDGTLAALGVKTVPEVDAEFAKLDKRFAALAAALKSGKISQEQYKKGVEDLQQAATDLESTSRVTSTGVKRLGRDFDAILPSARDLSEVLASIPKVQPPDMTPWPIVAAGFKSAAEAAEVLKVTLKTDVVKELRNAEKAYEALKKTAAEEGEGSLLTLQDEGAAVEYIAELYKKLGQAVPEEYEKIIKAAKKATDSTKSDWSKAFGTIATGLTVLSDQFEGSGGELVRTMATVAGKVRDALSVDGAGFKDVLKEIGPELAGQLGTQLGQIIGGNKSSYGGLGSMLGGALGSVIPGIGTVLGSAIGGLFGGLFGKKSKEEKAAEQLKRDIADVQKSYKALGDISENLAKQFVELKKEIGATRAEAKLLADMIQETGVTSKNFGAYMQKINNILYAMRTGAIKAEEGVSALNDSFEALISGVVDLGREGDKQLTMFIQRLRSVGLSVKSVDEYVYSWLDKASTGLQAMASAVAPGIEGLHDMEMQLADLIAQQKKLAPSSTDYKDLAKDIADLTTKIGNVKAASADAGTQIERVSGLIMSTFNAYIAQGSSWYEAMTAVAEPLATLRTKLDALGMTGGEAIQKLLKISDFAKANEEIWAAIDGNRQVLEALGNTGFLTATELKNVNDQTATYYKKLTDSGMDAHDALAVIAPTLADAVWYAKQLGIPLDDATKALVEQAKAAGVYKEKARSLEDVLKEGFDNIIDRFDRLIDRFGKAFPDAVNAGFDELDRRAQRSRQYVDELNDAAANGDWSEAGGSSAEAPPVTGAAAGFHGTVTGPRTFYIEPSVTERVDIGKGGGKPSVTVVERPVNIEPVFIPLYELGQYMIKFVEKKSAGEQMKISSRGIRG